MRQLALMWSGLRKITVDTWLMVLAALFAIAALLYILYIGFFVLPDA
jgi:hypothetical protein